MASASALITIERLLDGKTTLKTQRATHSNIICLGTELLNHITKIMNEDRERAVSEAVIEVERRSAEKLRSEIELLTIILRNEKEKKVEELTRDYEAKIKYVKRACEIAEETRAKEAYHRFEAEKKKAVDEAMEREQKERALYVKGEIDRISMELKEAARKEKEEDLAKQRKMLNDEAKKDIDNAILETKIECDQLKKNALKKLKNELTENINELRGSLEYMTQMLDLEKRRKEDLHQTLMELKEDYKRFQNYTNRFHSDYLLP